MKEFLFSIWFISLSSNLKLSIDIFIMSVRHVFADFRFIFVKCSCSRRDGTSLFSLFYKIILYIQGSRLRPKPFFESVRVKIWCGRTCASAWSALLQSAPLPAAAHCSRRKISLIRCKCFSRAWFHTARVKAEQRQRRSGAYAEREQRAPIALSLGMSAPARRCTQLRIWFSN